MRKAIYKYKKQLLISLSFLIPLIVYLITFYINGLLTNKTIISGDMYAQYYPLFNYLKGILDGTNSIFYSFSKGLGGTMFGTIFYYLSSPLNIFLIFINKNSIPDFMTCLVILKLSLCGLTMYLYMRKKHKKDNVLLLAFSLCYAFMGYNLNYFINIMWLDVIVMTPLVLIGLEKILENKSPRFYMITLFISILSNYYITYMLCVFSVLYLIYEIILKYNIKKDKQKIKKITKKFVISSLLTGLMCSFFLIPCILEMTDYGRGLKLEEIFIFDYNFFDLFSKTYIGTLDLNDTLNYSSMNLYCSIIFLPLIFLYFYNRKINKKEKRLTLLILLAMILPCFIGILNWIWHLFTIPMFYSYRYSFLLCFFLINIAYKSYENLEIKKKTVLLFMLFYLIISLYFIIITYYGKYYAFLNYKLIWITLIILILYLIMLSYINNKKILSLIIILECILNINIIFNKNDFNEKKITSKKYDNIIEKYNSKNRIEINDRKSSNNDLIYDTNGVNIFLSTTNYRVLDFLQKAGLNEEYLTNLYSINYQSIITDTMIGLKTIISPEKINYKKLDLIQEEINVYNNKNALSIGYMIKNECNNLEYEFPYDEKIFNCIFEKNNTYYKQYKIEKQDNTIEIKKEGYYYVYMPEIYLDTSIFEEESIKNIVYIGENYCIINNENKDTKIILDNNKDISDLKIYYFDHKEYEKVMEKLKIEQLDYRIEKNKLYGTIETKGGILLLTIPYEKGIKTYVDGNQVEYKEVLNTFIGIDLEEGQHEIEIEYEQPGLKCGMIVSVMSLILTIIYIKRSDKYE